ncbi:MAG: tRNA 2-selenouridine(34) synthase MnmH, partial [Proteobacteria bacterium]|nr:tRNA 2-selenouridine(34) synthase MnmH [Pseudomonadota bacterium]
MNTPRIFADHRRLLCDGVPLIDLRAPAEFTQGAFPGAINLPLLTDAERAA